MWTDGLIDLFTNAGHEVIKLSLPGRHWKWRMNGAANYLAEEFLKLECIPDVLIASDMLDLPVFVGMARSKLIKTKIVLYFHENQITYPWSPEDVDVELNRDQSYGYINLRSALCADEVYFNSNYHQRSFLEALENFIKQFPDATRKEWIRLIQHKSQVLYLGMDLSEFLQCDKVKSKDPILLWNHRWEYDKNPDEFYRILQQLKREQISFKLIVCGEKNKKYPKVFDSLKADFENELLHFGYASTRQEYLELLFLATILPVTSYQDFFGGSVVEAIAAGCIPVFPNRLAYPEHLPVDLKIRYLTKNEQEWFDLLKNITLDLSAFQQDIDKLTSHVSRYDWQNRIGDYLKMLK